MIHFLHQHHQIQKSFSFSGSYTRNFTGSSKALHEESEYGTTDSDDERSRSPLNAT